MSVALASQYEDALTLAVAGVRRKPLPRTASGRTLAPHRVKADALASRDWLLTGLGEPPRRKEAAP